MRFEIGDLVITKPIRHEPFRVVRIVDIDPNMELYEIEFLPGERPSWVADDKTSYRKPAKDLMSTEELSHEFFNWLFDQELRWMQIESEKRKAEIR